MSVYHASGKSVQGTGTGSNNLTATTSNTFTFKSSTGASICMKKVLLQNDADSGAKLYAKFNDSSCSATAYDVCLRPGDPCPVGESLLVSKVTLFSTVDMTFGEDFNLVGWQ